MEYVVLIIATISALLAMGIYIKRGMMGRLRSIQEQVGQPYSPGRTTSEEITRFRQKRQETFDGTRFGWSTPLAEEVEAANREAEEANAADPTNPQPLTVMTYVRTLADSVDVEARSERIEEDLGEGIYD